MTQESYIDDGTAVSQMLISPLNDNGFAYKNAGNHFVLSFAVTAYKSSEQDKLCEVIGSLKLQANCR